MVGVKGSSSRRVSESEDGFFLNVADQSQSTRGKSVAGRAGVGVFIPFPWAAVSRLLSLKASLGPE